MNNQTKIGLVALVMTLVVVMVWLMGSGTPETNKNARKTYISDNWDNHYQLNDKDPYGLFLFNQMLRAHVDTNKRIQPITDWIQLDSVLEKKKPVTMVYVGNKFGLQNKEIDSILNRVKEGSELFISYNELTDNLIKRFFNTYEIGYDYADSINVFINKNKYSMFYLYQNDTIATEWKAFYNIAPIDSNYRSLSSLMEMSNFIRIKLGAGTILLHTNPNFFYNYQVKRNEGYRYSSFVLNQLSKKNEIYLLELGRLLDENSTGYNGDEDGEGDVEDSSYLKFLLKSPAFMAAMGLVLVGLFLFLIFRSKRMQPIVPYIPVKKNMSLAFAETITSIYLSKHHPIGILRLQRKNFYDAVNKHFFVDISRRTEDREREFRILSEKSKIPQNEIMELLQLLEPSGVSNITDEYIVEIAKKQREFYLRTGIINDQIIQKIESRLILIQRNLFTSFLLILGGIFVVILGFYYLVLAIGIGIALWPIGTIVLAIGIRRLSIPLLAIEKESISYHPIFGKKKVCLIKDILHVKWLNNGYHLTFTENREITIAKFELSRFDKTQLERFIAKHHQIEV